MTRHEADVIGGLNMTDQISNEAYKQIMIATQDENEVGEVLDKIRAEIADLDDADYDYEGYYKAVTDALKIIDKYRKEIAMTKQEDEQISFDGVFCDKSAMKKLGCLGNCIGCTHWAYDEDAKRKRCINPKLEKLKGDSE